MISVCMYPPHPVSPVIRANRDIPTSREMTDLRSLQDNGTFKTAYEGYEAYVVFR